MADQASLAATLVAQLGTPYEPFGWGHVLVLCALAAAGAACLALEYGLARLVAKLFQFARAPAPRAPEPPRDEP